MIDVFSDSDTIFTIIRYKKILKTIFIIIRYRKILKTRSQPQQCGLSQDTS